jgi:hypothetical protein
MPQFRGEKLALGNLANRLYPVNILGRGRGRVKALKQVSNIVRWYYPICVVTEVT